MSGGPAAAAGVLPFIRRGTPSARAPLVLLHGFGGNALGWTNVQLAIARRRDTLAFDLPGHGAALGWPVIGNAGHAAAAVTASLDRLGLARVHLAGHSMGGAVAALIALRSPERVASLTLAAPGGFGPTIDAGLLRAFAAARSETEVAPLLARFYGAGHRLPRRMAAAVAADRGPARLAALAAVVEAILDGDGQKTIDRAALAAAGCPVKVIWGREDRVIPVEQTDDLPPAFALHRLPGVGHMPQEEAHELCVRLIGEMIAAE